MRSDQAKTAVKRTPFGALSNQVRLDVISALVDGGLNVTELVRKLGRSQALVSHALQKLVDAGFVQVRPDGRYRRYSLNDEFAAPFLSAIGQGGKGISGDTLRILLEHSPVSIAVTDAHGVFTFICGEMVTKHKVPERAFIGRSIHDLFYEDRRNIVEQIGRALAGETVHWVTRHGPLAYDVMTVPFRGRDGLIAGVINVARESRPKDAAQGIREDGEWKALAEGTPYTLIQIGQDYRIQVINRTSRGGHVVGRSLIDMLPEAYRARAKAAIDQALSTGRVTDYVTKASITPQNPAGKWYACRV
ncbi:MAG TPA: metalloregulator ArsR/SmtB family transcription factor, partial [Candidatus Binatia bacterium]|nr:metalloregulator ArsR/SmtB family transcription factor [Candidatus Binatia bacterium]